MLKIRYLSWVLAVLTFLSQISAAIACGAPQAKASPSSVFPKRFVIDKGWPLPDLQQLRAKKSIDSYGAQELDYTSENASFGSIELEGFEIDPGNNSLRLVPGYKQRIDEVIEYKSQGRTFAYDLVTESIDIEAAPLALKYLPLPKPDKYSGVLGCGLTRVRIFDQDGDGIFESLEYAGFGGSQDNSVERETIPEWALNLLPNKEAVDKYRRQGSATKKN